MQKNKLILDSDGSSLPFESAGEHFNRLKKEGITSVRLIVTWQAIEHEGAGIYDEAYLAYLRKILITADKEGISVFIDPHQDMWSHWMDGGAPTWTIEKLGMNFDNHDHYITATMFSLFFAGNVYAQNLQIEDENIQDWLQNHCIAAFKHLQRRLKNCRAIAGWGSVNEPHCGFIGHQNLENTENFFPQAVPRFSPWQLICAASSLFKDGFSCPWKQAGVWREEDGKPKLLRADHFSQYQGRRVNFADDFLKPFIAKYKNTLDANTH